MKEKSNRPSGTAFSYTPVTENLGNNVSYKKNKDGTITINRKKPDKKKK